MKIRTFILALTLMGFAGSIEAQDLETLVLTDGSQLIGYRNMEGLDGSLSFVAEESVWAVPESAYEVFGIINKEGEQYFDVEFKPSSMPSKLGQTSALGLLVTRKDPADATSPITALRNANSTTFDKVPRKLIREIRFNPEHEGFVDFITTTAGKTYEGSLICLDLSDGSYTISTPEGTITVPSKAITSRGVKRTNPQIPLSLVMNRKNRINLNSAGKKLFQQDAVEGYLISQSPATGKFELVDDTYGKIHIIKYANVSSMSTTPTVPNPQARQAFLDNLRREEENSRQIEPEPDPEQTVNPATQEEDEIDPEMP